MKVAVVGSRGICVENLEKYLPVDCSEIVSGGAVGVDSCAEKYAKTNNIVLRVFLPDYQKFGRAAPIVRNKQIVDYADTVIAFWDGKSKGTLSVIKYCEKMGIPCRIVMMNSNLQR